MDWTGQTDAAYGTDRQAELRRQGSYCQNPLGPPVPLGHSLTASLPLYGMRTEDGLGYDGDLVGHGMGKERGLSPLQ
jgi:hypothetical protein